MADNKMTDIAKDQLDASSETVVAALTALSTQIKDSRTAGSDKAKEIVAKFGGENKITDLIADIAGLMTEATSATMTIGATPMIVMAGAAKGVYKKITDSSSEEK